MSNSAGYVQWYDDSSPTLYFTYTMYCLLNRPCDKCDFQSCNDRIKTQTVSIFQFTETYSVVFVCDVNHSKYIDHATDQQNT
jgi:hypothetical protein